MPVFSGVVESCGLLNLFVNPKCLQLLQLGTVRIRTNLIHKAELIFYTDSINELLLLLIATYITNYQKLHFH